MATGEFGERMQGLTTPAPASSGTRAGRECDHGDFAVAQGFEAESVERFELRAGLREIRHVVFANVFDDCIRREPILRETDSSLAKARPNLFVLFRIETVRREERGKTLVPVAFGIPTREQRVEKCLNHSAQLGFCAARGAEFIQLRTTQW